MQDPPAPVAVVKRAVIGVHAPLLAGSFYGLVLSGLADELRREGYSALVLQTVDVTIGDRHVDVSSYDVPVGWDRVSGFVAFGNAVTPAYLGRLHATGKPLVVLCGEAKGLACPSVQADNSSGVRAAVADLLGHGHTRIGFLGSLRNSDFQERYDAYRGALLQAGIEPDPRFYYDTETYVRDGGLDAAARLLADGMPTTAMIAGNDHLALGLLEGLGNAGLRIPQDQAVIGFDDTEGSSWAGLSTVSQHVEYLGARAAALVVSALNGQIPEPRMHRMPTSFVPRLSCGCSGVSGAIEPARRSQTPLDAFRAALLTVLGTAPGTVEAVNALADAYDGNALSALQAAAAGVYELYPRPDSVTLVLSAVQAHRRAAGDDHSRQVAEQHLVRSLTDMISSGAQDRSGRLQAMLRDGFDIGVDLLSNPAEQAGSLSWLQRTTIRSAAVAFWETDGEQLSLAGVFDRADPYQVIAAQTIPAAQFPPQSVLDSLVGGTDLAFCLPLTTANRDWGLLCVVGPVEIDTPSGRENYFQWSALFAVALDQRQVLERERVLLEDIRTSQERYALATESAGAGMWDWHLTAGRVYYCSRWRSLLGHPFDAVGDSPQEWLSRVHSDDLPALEAALEVSRSREQRLHVEHRMRTRDGSYRWMLAQAVTVRDFQGGVARLVGSLTDVTQRRELEDQLRHQALYDPLTGLPNRALFFDRLERAIAIGGRRPESDFAVLFLDLDGFKVVNDSLGHPAGDLLLVQVAERLRACVRQSDTAARLGGDEFAILLSDADSLAAVLDGAQRLQQALSEPYDLQGHQLVVPVSIGITTGQGRYHRPEDMLRDADIAMYRAKSRGRGGHAVFDPAMYEGAVNRLRLESDLRQGLDEGQLVPYYQPIVALQSGHAVGLEALARWPHPERGLVMPGDFLPVAEETGLIVPLGRRLLEAICRDLTALKGQGLLSGEARISVNVSNREFWQTDLLGQLDAILERCQVPAEWLTVEITEGVVMGNAEQARGILQQLQARGLHLHIDDFGTGYSSLQALHRFPIHALKIDRSFIARLDTERASRELVRTMVLMAENLGFDVIAEGIENPRQRDLLLELGCRYGQGYWFGRPADSGRTAEHLRLTLDGHPAPATTG